jgi:2,3-bisphosphoglycerate-independent phosphoglycerate mutase
MLTKGEAETFSVPSKALEASYAQDITDEYIKPCLIEAPAGRVNTIQPHDVVLITNFRNDRPRQITERFLHQGPEGIWLATMTQYNPDYQTKILFEPQPKPVSVGQIISDAGLRQLRITETEKFPHMTFFINCQHQQPLEKEDRTMFDSYSDIPTHDKRPAMRTPDVARAIVDDIRAEKHEVIFTNLCNADMLGHTGNIPAAIEGCETVDAALSSIVPTALEYGFSIIIIADHGNADQMLDEETGELITSHSLNPVPFILVSGQYSEIKRKSGTLIDIAPTILTMLGLPVPQEMTGESFV